MGLDEILEALWDQLLSGQAEVIRNAYLSLEPQTQAAVLTHLRRMVNEEGWHPLQQDSARTALAVIELQTRTDQKLND